MIYRLILAGLLWTFLAKRMLCSA
ncbi:hypothetical protein KL86APRO_10290 [uncultured Alphaproteobacteria bacterium]|uniref:Uncharacterized protein n=1 Tax=uncultured Alphaproteobacteria bacterium TaxID=91750 RepID=A0A212J032_9PROT|nr:hypothetical protein KL86APRO_10290 [uncultured Alphaproteobacteria bacterium]